MSASDYLDKASQAAESAELLLRADDLDGAANRAYYAMFHAARAALFSVGDARVGSHGTIIGRFAQTFVKDGPLPRELGRAINGAQQLRNAGDYKLTRPDRVAVQEVVAAAHVFVAAVRDLVFTRQDRE